MPWPLSKNTFTGRWILTVEEDLNNNNDNLSKNREDLNKYGDMTHVLLPSVAHLDRKLNQEAGVTPFLHGDLKKRDVHGSS